MFLSHQILLVSVTYNLESNILIIDIYIYIVNVNDGYKLQVIAQMVTSPQATETPSAPPWGAVDYRSGEILTASVVLALKSHATRRQNFGDLHTFGYAEHIHNICYRR
jgi:hypothetical protein